MTKIANRHQRQTPAVPSVPADKPRPRRSGRSRVKREATKPDIEPLAVRVETAAKLINCGITKVKALIAEGTLDSVKVGAMRLVKYSSLKRLIDS